MPPVPLNRRQLLTTAAGGFGTLALAALLSDDDALMAEITGLTLADRFEQEFREFFRVYLELCR